MVHCREDLLESNEIALLGHINSLQGSIQPHLYLSLGGFGIVSRVLVLPDENLPSIAQENTTAAQSFDVLDRVLNLKLVFARVELLVDGVLDEEVQQRVL